jgi:tRNA1(Val) A37 N6-methylase TrmN6
LYYYTNLFDIVYDPFAGGGATIDACHKWFRRFYVYDRKPIETRTEIQKFDIKDGLPKNLPNDIKLVYLDPPYWKQAENKYSQDKEDLANMSLEQFYENLVNFVKLLKKKLSPDGRIALIISATQWKNENYKRTDHAFDLAKEFAQLGFQLEQRFICPYSSEQYNASQVNIAKEKKICLNLYRDLMVFKLEK